MIKSKIEAIPLGYSEVIYRNKKYGLTRTDFNQGLSIKIFAEELGGNDIISLNFYVTKTSDSLRPCEMPLQKVIDFLNGYTVDK